MGTVTISTWIKRGDMSVNAYALDWYDEDHPYNQIKRQGKNPEEYGVHHPLMNEFRSKSRSELVEEIGNLRRELESLHRDMTTWR